MLATLPTTVPSDLPPAESTYNFGAAEADIAGEGLAYALNRNLEVCFQTHISANIRFIERGRRLDGLITMLEHAQAELSAPEWDFVGSRWIARLIEAAISSGATR